MMRRGAALGKKCQTVAVVAYRATFDDLISKPKKKIEIFCFCCTAIGRKTFLGPIESDSFIISLS